MSKTDRDIERLIVRKLDNELTANEGLELDRELIRNPDARRLMDEYQEIDGLAALALQDTLGGEDFVLDPTKLPDRSHAVGARHYYHRGWWLVPGAVAAAVLALLIARFPLSVPNDSTIAGRGSQTFGPIVPVVGGNTTGDGIMRNVSTNPYDTKRQTGREVIGVVGEDGNLYWIEVERTRTVKRLRPGARRPYRVGGM